MKIYIGTSFSLKPNSTHFDEGYIALICVILMSAIVSMLISSHALVVWNSGQSSLQAWAKEQSYTLADSCVRLAVLQLKASVYPSARSIAVEDNSCDIVSVQNTGGTWEVRTHAAVVGAETNLLANLDQANFTVTMESEPP